MPSLYTGAGVGVAVGFGVGTAVGFGATIGFGVGAAVGFGATVGFGVGAAVGFGATVGFGVGVGVASVAAATTSTPGSLTALVLAATARFDNAKEAHSVNVISFFKKFTSHSISF